MIESLRVVEREARQQCTIRTARLRLAVKQGLVGARASCGPSAISRVQALNLHLAVVSKFVCIVPCNLLIYTHVILIHFQQHVL